MSTKCRSIHRFVEKVHKMSKSLPASIGIHLDPTATIGVMALLQRQGDVAKFSPTARVEQMPSGGFNRISLDRRGIHGHGGAGGKSHGQLFARQLIIPLEKCKRSGFSFWRCCEGQTVPPCHMCNMARPILGTGIGVPRAQSNEARKPKKSAHWCRVLAKAASSPISDGQY